VNYTSLFTVTNNNTNTNTNTNQTADNVNAIDKKETASNGVTSTACDGIQQSTHVRILYGVIILLTFFLLTCTCIAGYYYIQYKNNTHSYERAEHVELELEKFALEDDDEDNEMVEFDAEAQNVRSERKKQRLKWEQDFDVLQSGSYDDDAL